jgi:HK97 family phage prohead protease
MATPEKYNHISFVPPSGVRREAARGLAFRREHGRGGTAIGIARARDLSNGTELSPSTLRRMKAFFDRHAPDRKATGFRAGEEGFPSNGKIADLLWGGRSGESWANKVVRQMNAADERTYSLDLETATLEEEAVSQRSAVMQGVERRYFGSFEKADSNSLTVEHRADPETGKKRTYIVGYAAKFGTDSLLLGDFVERLEPTAFDIVKAGKDKSGKPIATRCLFNHDPNHLLGRFPTTMKLIVDKIGLRYECLLPDSRQDIAEMIIRQDLRGSSFSFVIDEDGGEKWITEDGQSIRLVRKIKSLLDVSPVTYPAYDDATVAIAKRSYEVFSSEKKKIIEVRSNVTSEIEKTRAFLDERRAFCATGAGGGIDNSCGSSSDQKQDAQQSLDKYEAARKTTGGKIAEAAAKGAVIGGAVGLAGGAVGAAIGSITGAFLNAAGHGVAAAISSIAKGNLDSLVKSIGTTHESLSSASQSLFGGDKKPFAIDSKTIAIESGDSIALVSSGSQFSKAAGTAFHFQPGADVGGKLDISAVEKAAKAVGAKVVSAEVWSDKDVKALTSKGYREVVKSPGGYSTSKGVYEKKLSRSKRAEEFEAEYAKNMKFFEERAFCATGSGGGVDNSCGKYMQMDVSSADSVKKSAKDAQEFVDKAREEQLSKGGKDGGQADEGGGVQTWSKGDHFPWTVKQVGDTDGHVQGLHPDGSKTEAYPFKGGDTSAAMKQVSDEIKRRKSSRADQVIAETLKFLKDRRA